MSGKQNRPIDRLRDSAVSLAIGSPDDTGGAVALFEIESRLCAITANAVYAVQLADQIDPQRTNPIIRNSTQRLLSAGADNAIVSGILLTAERLLKSTFIGKSFPERAAVDLAWQQTKDVTALAKIVADLEATQERIIAEFDATKITPNQITLPTMDDAEHRFDAFAQKLGHAVNTLQRIAQLFYPELTSKWIDSITNLAAERYGRDAPFARYMNEVRPTLLFMLDLRNMIEHPKPGQCAKVSDFRLIETGQILVPSVAFEGSPYETSPNALHTIMRLLTEGIASMTEFLIVHLCNTNVKPQGIFDVEVVELSPTQRGPSRVRFAYGSYRDGQLFCFS